MCVAAGKTKSVQAGSYSGKKSMAVPRRGANDTQSDHTYILSPTHTHRHRNEYTFSICVLSKQIEKTHTRTYPVILQWTKTGKTGKNKSKGRNK